MEDKLDQIVKACVEQTLNATPEEIEEMKRVYEKYMNPKSNKECPYGCKNGDDCVDCDCDMECIG